MTEREQWRERMRARIRKQDAAASGSGAAIDGDTAALVAAASARTAPAYKSYASPDDWGGRGVKGVEASRRARSEGLGLTHEEWKRRQAEGVRRRHSRLRAELMAAGERACTDCGATKPLDQFRVRLADPEPLAWFPYCRECEAKRSAERQKRRGSKATMTPEQAQAIRVAGTKALHQRRHDELVAAGEKACGKCGEVKALTEFGLARLPSGRTGWQSYCRACNAAYARERHAKNKTRETAA